tara:strand:+ start:1065 stop:1895 length:831 start_codon:yes stop_codon:yes gene_type:complete
MDTEALLQVEPSELAATLLNRRLMLKESLPGVIRNLEAEEESLSPKVERMKKSFEEANGRVAKLKEERGRNQKEAGALIPEVKGIREDLINSGGMISLDPKWKKKKLIDQIEEIENRIQTSALDHKDERKLLEKRRALVAENDKWVRDRKESNPEMTTYLEKNMKMSKLFKKADKTHSKMLEAVSKAQPIYQKLSKASEELKEITSQLDRARELLSQSDRAIAHWEKRLESGFGDMGPGFRDLLKAQRTVDRGGNSSFSKISSVKSKPGKESREGK